MRIHRRSIGLGLLGVLWLLSLGIIAEGGLIEKEGVSLHPLFSDHAVLQRGKPLPIWGWGTPGELVDVSFAGQSKHSRVGSDGRWKVLLDPLKAGGPYELRVESGIDILVVQDVYLGEVWICSGQSNMGVKMRGRDNPIVNGPSEAAQADRPLLRYFDVHRNMSLYPEESLDGQWQLSSPESVYDFSAVAYFFGRDLLERLDVPIGLIHASWGGTGAQFWVSPDGLNEFPEYVEEMADVREAMADPEGVKARFAAELEAWYCRNDPGSVGAAWADPKLSTINWEVMTLPGAWEEQGHPGFDGIAWFRSSFDLPSGWNGEDLRLKLGRIDYFGTIWINGHRIGANNRGDVPTVFTVPGIFLNQKENVIAVRALDGGGEGGLLGGYGLFGFEPFGDPEWSVSLAGEWRARISNPINANDPVPAERWDNPMRPSCLYNGMIAPLVPFSIRGVAWYQGESNRDVVERYCDLFSALIEDWRDEWSADAFPFLYVQVAPYFELPPELREAQLQALSRVPKTAMVVTTDVGDADDVHPLNKEPVGERLALAARAVAYGEPIEYSGPVFDKVTFSRFQALVSFTHIGKGLVAPGGNLSGFTMAGADGVFYAATATIVGDRVEVVSDKVAKPVAVRYGWANVPDGNLFNKDGLPASPFRSDPPFSGKARSH